MKRRLLAGCALAAAAMAPAAAFAQLALDPAGTHFAGGGAPAIAQTGATTDITLGASRTILSWTSFNLGAGQGVVYRLPDPGAIVLNRVSGQAVINGQVTSIAGAQQGAGNVWFSAPGGVFFGQGAKIDVGGLLATSASVNPAGFLDPSNFSFGFSGGGAGRVEVASGADIKVGGGAVALIAGAVSTQAGSAITGGSTSTALFAAAGDFTVRFSPQAGDLDLLDFIVPAGGGTPSATPLSLGGQTVAGGVILAVVNRADVASAVISAPGVLAAQSASLDHGDVVLSAGADIVGRLPGAARNTTTTTTANVGVAVADRDLVAAFAQPTALSATQLASGRDLGLLAASLDAGSVNAGRLLAVNAASGIAIRTGASAGSAASFRSNGAMTAAGPISIVGRAQFDVGSLSAGEVNSGRSIVVNASGAGASGGPAVSIQAGLAEDDILVTTTNAAGSIFLGSAFITGARNDEAPAGRTISLTARGANADVVFGPAAGASMSGATNVQFEAGRDVTANVSGGLVINSGVAGRTLTLRTGDLEIVGPLSAPTVRIESIGRPVFLGAGGPGLSISQAELGRVTATTELQFAAGSGGLTVTDLNVDPAKVARLVLGAGGGADVTVSGVLAPTVTGGSLAIGGTSAGQAFQPGRIVVTGSIGVSSGNAQTGFTGVRAFNEVSLSAQHDILIGSPRFVALVANVPADQIDVSHDLPAGAAPTAAEQDRLSITAGRLTLAAADRIVSQNTGATGQANGVYLTNTAGQTQVLTIDPADVVDIFGVYSDSSGTVRTSLTSGVVGVTSPPEAGQHVRLNGCEFSACGAGASSTNSVKTLAVASYTPPTPGSGPIGSSPPAAGPAGGGSTSAESGGGETGGDDDAGGSGDQADSGGDSGDQNGEGAAIASQPPLLGFASPDLSQPQSDPVVMGAGSDELWRSRRTPPPKP